MFKDIKKKNYYKVCLKKIYIGKDLKGYTKMLIVVISVMSEL